ncbi:MAG TPA: hypothetical protein VN455_04960 [Methanotrichaceae archaeon]|nr:hypothetical protein [Methanotrichaceae archaeon]
MTGVLRGALSTGSPCISFMKRESDTATAHTTAELRGMQGAVADKPESGLSSIYDYCYFATDRWIRWLGGNIMTKYLKISRKYSLNAILAIVLLMLILHAAMLVAMAADSGISASENGGSKIAWTVNDTFKVAAIPDVDCISRRQDGGL